jgi:hypothetical protein
MNPAAAEARKIIVAVASLLARVVETTRGN